MSHTFRGLASQPHKCRHIQLSQQNILVCGVVIELNVPAFVSHVLVQKIPHMLETLKFRSQMIKLFFIIFYIQLCDNFSPSLI